MSTLDKAMLLGAVVTVGACWPIRSPQRTLYSPIGETS